MSRKFLLSLLFVTTALALPAAAQTTTIRIAGAATYRPAVQKAVEDILNSGFTFAYDGTRYKPLASIYSGTLNTGQPNPPAVIIKTYWTGDVSGVVALSSGTLIDKWIDSSITGTTTGTSLTGAYAKETTGGGVAPDISIAVSNSSSSAAVASTAGFAGSTASDDILNIGLVNAGTAANASKGVGIAAFQWVLGRLGAGFTPPFTNISQAQAAALINGPTPLSFFTGDPNDKFKYVFLVGRSEDAGARTIPFAEAQTGFYTPPLQYQLSFSSNGTNQADGLPTGGKNATVTGLYFWPADSALNAAPTLNWNAPGHSGYSLTSDLANALSAINPVLKTSLTIGTGTNPTPTPTGITHAYFVGYNAVVDTATLQANGATPLSYNGVPYTSANVKNGFYSLWAYAHVYYIGSGTRALTGVAKQVADKLADKIRALDADTDGNGAVGTGAGAGIVLDSSVLVGRNIDGGVTFKTY